MEVITLMAYLIKMLLRNYFSKVYHLMHSRKESISILIDKHLKFLYLLYSTGNRTVGMQQPRKKYVLLEVLHHCS